MKSFSKIFTLVVLGILMSSSTFAQLTVYPGDANNNGRVDNIDVLTVVSDLGKTGSSRADDGFIFQATQVNSWMTDSTMLNDAYSDCNGDGIVSENDISFIGLHYGKMHQPFVPDSFPIIISGQSPELYLSSTVDSLFPGLDFGVDVILGTSAVPAQDVYGIAFSIRFDAAMVVGDSIASDFYSGFLGNDVYVFTKLVVGDSLSIPSQLDVTISRKDNQPMSGFGRIGTFYIVMEENVSGKIAPNLDIEIDRVLLINQMQQAQPVTPIDFSQRIYITSSQRIIDHPAKIYPNPAKERIYIDVLNLKMNRIKLYNALGQVVKHQVLNRQSAYELPLADLSPGLYLLAIETNKGIIMKKIITRF